MSDNNFDKHIKDQIDGFQIDFDKSNWDALNSRLDQEFGTKTTTSDDLSFDKEIANKLSSQQTPYNSSHWAKLLERLELDDSVRNRLISLTIMEVTAIVLVIFAIWNWKGAEYFQKHKENQSTNIPVASLEEESLDEDFKMAGIKEATIISSEYIVAIPEQDQRAVSENIHNTSSLEKENPSIESINEIKSISKSNDLAEIRLETGNNSVNQSIANNTIVNKSSNAIIKNTSVFQSKKRTDAFDNLNTGIVGLENNSKLNKNQSTIAGLSTLTNDQFVDLKAIQPLDQMHILVNRSKPDNRLQYSTGLIGSADAYLIRSPDDPVYPYPSYYTDSKGLTGGALFSIRSKNIELETGLLYSSVEYAPRRINEPYSSLGQYYITSLDNILFNVISIPVNFKLHYSVREKNSFYVALGSTYNAIINSNFNISNTIIAAPLSPAADDGENEPKLNRKPQIAGALEGGSLSENTFITADLGIGYQHYVSSRLNLFVQPTLHTHFYSGIGPNGDKLHKMSLFAGAKYDLN